MWPRERKGREKEKRRERVKKKNKNDKSEIRYLEGGERVQKWVKRVRRKRRRKDKIKVRSCPKAQPSVEFVRGGDRGREKSSTNTCLFLTPNKSESSSSVCRSLLRGEGYIL